jgi:multiple antibiotic resistance protein
MNPLLEYILFAFSSLFIIVDPLATIPAFISMTPDDTVEDRQRMARLACTVMTVVLVVFAVAGKWIFKYLSITMPAFEIAASVVLMLVAIDMLRAQRSRMQETKEETAAGAHKTDIAITPLAVPMLAGPGAISTVIVLQSRAESDVLKRLALFGCILAVSLVSYLILRTAASGARWLSPIALRITTRIMGLLLAAVAIQFLLKALQDLGVPLTLTPL